MPVTRTSGQGRPKGAKNKATAEVKEFALQYGPAAIEALARLAGLLDKGVGRAESETAQIMAANSILDRAYGKPSQAIEHSGDIAVHDGRDKVQAEVDALLHPVPPTSQPEVLH